MYKVLDWIGKDEVFFLVCRFRSLAFQTVLVSEYLFINEIVCSLGNPNRELSEYFQAGKLTFDLTLVSHGCLL